MKAILDFIWDKSPWYMKCLVFIFLAPVAIGGACIGAFMAVDGWVIERANTVVSPIRSEFINFKSYSKTHEDRVERELGMIRSQNDELKNILIKKLR